MRFSAPPPVMSRPVRVCAVQYALRAIEYQIYTVTTGMVGSLPLMTYFTSQTAGATRFTPGSTGT